jgi:hypothetical protein
MMRNARHFKALSRGGAALVGLVLALSACKNPLTQEVRTLAAVAGSSKISLAVNSGAAAAIGNGASYDFGTVGTSDAPAVATFTVTNAGVVALAIPSASATFGGSNAGCFSYVSKPPASLAPQASATFSISFTPGTAGPKSATAIFASNDVSAKSFSFSLTGTGIDAAAKPIFSGGNLQCWPGGSTTVSISDTTSNATIYYTTNNTPPSLATLGSTTSKYTNPFFLDFSLVPKTVQAMAVAPGLANSAPAVAIFSKTSVSTPMITPGATFMSNVPIPSGYGPSVTAPIAFSITSSTTGSTVYIAFSIDGSAPDSYSTPSIFDGSTTPPTANGVGTYIMPNGGSFLYGGAHVNGVFELKAIAFVQDGGTNFVSPAATPSTFQFQMSPPTWIGVQPLVTYYANAQAVTIGSSSGRGGTASISYSTLGAVADVTDVTYGAPVAADIGPVGYSRSVTITAIAHQTDWQDSAQLSDVFHICGPGKWDSSNWDQATWQ